MRLFRIGDKVVSMEKLTDSLERILADRESGATQEEAARHHGVQRAFVSFIETLGEIRRGPKVALVGFPVSNAEDVRRVAEEHGVEFVLLFSQEERESLENGPGSELFNLVLETLASLRDCDLIIVLASDWRVDLVERILGREVLGIPLGTSPLRKDVDVDIGELDTLLATVTTQNAKLRD